jgi:hypothetical protein
MYGHYPGRFGAFGLGFSLVGLVLYFLPTIIAAARRNHVLAIFLIDLFLGWTCVGWIVALILSLVWGPSPGGSGYPPVYPGAPPPGYYPPPGGYQPPAGYQPPPAGYQPPGTYSPPPPGPPPAPPGPG